MTDTEWIRCKDCRYCYQDVWCDHWKEIVEPDDFCNYAEKGDGDVGD